MATNPRFYGPLSRQRLAEGGEAAGWNSFAKRIAEENKDVVKSSENLFDFAVDILPIVGDAEQVREIYQAYREGRKLDAASEAAMMALGYIPMGGPLARVVIKNLPPDYIGVSRAVLAGDKNFLKGWRKANESDTLNAKSTSNRPRNKSMDVPNPPSILRDRLEIPDLSQSDMPKIETMFDYYRGLGNPPDRAISAIRHNNTTRDAALKKARKQKKSQKDAKLQARDLHEFIRKNSDAGTDIKKGANKLAKQRKKPHTWYYEEGGSIPPLAKGK